MAAIKEIPLILHGQAINGIKFSIGSTVNFNLTCLDPDTRLPISLIGSNVIMSISSLNLSGNPNYPPLVARQASSLTAFGTCVVPIADGDTAPTPATAFKPGAYGADVWLTDASGNRLQMLGFIELILTPAVSLPGASITPLPSQLPLAQGPPGAAGLITCTTPILVNGVAGPVTTGANFTLSIATAGIGNSLLTNPSLTVLGSGGLTGGGAVALGASTSITMPDVGPGSGQISGYLNSITLDAKGRVTAVTTGVPTGAITGTTPIRINGGAGPVNASNDITVSIAAGGVTNAMLQNSAITVTAGSGLTGGGSTSLGGTATLSIPSAGVTNAMLVNSTVELDPGNGLSGAGAIALGATASLDLRLNSAGGLSKVLGGGTNELGIAAGGVVNSMITSVAGSKITGAVPLATSGLFAGYNVLSYGAVPDGSTDNTTAFTNALTAANSNGVGIVYVPSGTYAFATRFPWTYSDVALVGYGEVTLTSTNYTTLEFFSSCSNVTFNGIKFESTYVDSASLPWGIVQAFSETSNHFSLSNIQFINCEMTGADAAEGFKFINQTPSTEQFEDFKFINCNIHDIGRAGLVFQNHVDDGTSRYRNIFVQDCTFSNTGLTGNVGTGQGVSFSGVGVNCVTDNCLFSNAEFCAIEYTDGGRGRITNNRFKDYRLRSSIYYSAISMTGAVLGIPGMVVTGNQDVEAPGTAVVTWNFEYQDGAVISNNLTLGAGFSFLQSSNCIISGNTLKSKNVDALYFEDTCTNNKVYGNILSTTGCPSPFSVVRFYGATVTNNIVTDNDVFFSTGVEWDELNGATGNIYYLNRPNSSSSIVLYQLGPTTARQHTVPSVTSDTFTLLAASQVLTNKTINGPSNTLTNIANASLANSAITATAGTGLTGGGATSLGGSFTLGIDSTVATLTGSQVLTNKTISGASNTLSNIANASLTNSSITATAGTGLTGGGATSLGGSFTIGIDSTVATLTGSQVLTNKTLTAPIVNGLSSASGNADFSGSSGTFKTTSGASTFGGSSNTFSSGAIGPVSGQQHTLPAVSSDTIALIAASQTLTNKTISGSSNTISSIANASLTNSSFTATAGTGLSGTATVSLGGTFTFAIDSTVATLTGSQVLTNKTLTTPVINGLSSASGNADFSGSSGTFKSTTGATTLGGSSTTVSNTITLNADIAFLKEVDHYVSPNTSTSTTTVGATLTVAGAAGASGANGGQLILIGGPGGNTANGGILLLRGGAAGSGGTASTIVIGDSNTTSIQLGASGISTVINGLTQVKLGLIAAGSVSNDFSGSTGTFKTSTGAGTFGGSSNTFTNGVTSTTVDSGTSLSLGTSSASSVAIGSSAITTAIAGNTTIGSSSSNTLGITAVINADITFIKEVARTVAIAASTTASTIGAAMTYGGAAGSAGTGATAGAAGGSWAAAAGTGGVGGSSASAGTGGNIVCAAGVGGASAGSGAGGTGGIGTFRGGAGGAGSSALAGGVGGSATIRGGSGGAGTASALSGNGGALNIQGGGAGASGGFGAGTAGVINLAQTNCSQLTIGAAAIPIQMDGYLTLGIPMKVGTNVASAATIALTAPITHVTGVTGIDTITAPTDFAQTGVGGQLTIIPDGIFTTSLLGNIAIATTTIVGKALTMTYDNGTSKWYPSY